ncbi:MAG: DUF2513 domain-containing protein [Sphingomonas sp.]|uniref:DUF2513 domain-containing protein n=1 Tax=Sphingomonas sp. TaxID=28214 RepID=UPI001AC64D9D|nr:DUF2513 domain-containing protein [Sphingomonas sp.]MBN8815296.1 DUF2513 domain-containing protein [Sphingomonas sp.]
MKRDMDKVRGVMLALEAKTGPFVLTYDTPSMGGTDDGAETVEYIVLLHSGGFLESTQRNVYRLSWAGHEFLDSVRDPEIWRQTKDGAAKIGSWSITLLGELAKGFLRAKAASLGLPIG